MSWTFDQGPNVAATTTRQVMEGESPVLLVTHFDDDGSWGFFCGTTDEDDDFMLVSMEQVTNTDPGLLELGNLPLGWSAHRESPASPWIRF